MKRLAVLPWLLAAALWASTPGGGPLHPACAAAAGAHHVALVVQHAGGGTLDYCVTFDGDSVTGEQVLQLAAQQYGLEYRTVAFGSLGDAVCQIDYEPQTYPASCWTSSSDYWSMFVSRGGGAWSGSSRGVSTQTFADGDGEGWHYIPQSGAAAPPPSAAGVCKPAASAPPPTSASQPAAAQPPPAQPPPAAVAPEVPVPASPDLAPATPAPATNAPAASPSSAATAVAVERRAAPARNAPLSPGLLLAALAFGALAGAAVLRLVRLRR